jgi:hypothetical protein
MPVVSLPAPYGGQNNKEGAYNLGPEFATSLVNWVPGPGYLDTRGPCTAFSDNNAGAPIQSLWGHPNGNVIFSLENGDIYLAQTTIGAAITTAPTNGDFHGNTFQDRLILCNGVDVPQIYDGTNVAAGVYTGIATPANLYGSLTFKGRVYYWENGKRLFWYANAGSFQGLLASFDLSTFTRGDGVLESICPLTFDGGSGPDDLIAFLFSNGEVLIYQGDDPGNTNAWQQVGAFRIGGISGRACWAVVGSSTLVATDLGVVDLARALSTGAMDDSAVIGQQFGAVNMGVGVERKLVFDPYNRILWLALFGSNPLSLAQNLETLHGMDTESRAWFKTSNIAYDGGVFSGTATALYAKPTGLILGATTVGRLVNGPARQVTVNPVDDFFTNGALRYDASQVFALDAPGRNKQCQGIAVQMQQVSATSPSATMTYEIDSEQSITSPALGYLPAVTTRAFNSAAAYGTRIFLDLKLTSKSGIRWFNTDLLVRAGREV